MEWKIMSIVYRGTVNILFSVYKHTVYRELGNSGDEYGTARGNEPRDEKLALKYWKIFSKNILVDYQPDRRDKDEYAWRVVVPAIEATLSRAQPDRPATREN